MAAASAAASTSRPAADRSPYVDSAGYVQPGPPSGRAASERRRQPDAPTARTRVHERAPRHRPASARPEGDAARQGHQGSRLGDADFPSTSTTILMDGALRSAPLLGPTNSSVDRALRRRGEPSEGESGPGVEGAVGPYLSSSPRRPVGSRGGQALGSVPKPPMTPHRTRPRTTKGRSRFAGDARSPLPTKPNPPPLASLLSLGYGSLLLGDRFVIRRRGRSQAPIVVQHRVRPRPRLISRAGARARLPWRRTAPCHGRTRQLSSRGCAPRRALADGISRRPRKDRRPLPGRPAEPGATRR